MKTVNRIVGAGVRRLTPAYGLETMGAVGLPGTAQARCIRARSVEYQQVGSWPMAVVEDTGIDDRVTIALLHEIGTAKSCSTVGIQFIESPDT